MARKRKKKTNNARQHHMLRHNAKRQEQVFWKKTAEIADTIGAKITPADLPEKEKEFLLRARINPLQVRSTQEVKFPHSRLKEVQTLIHEFFASKSFSFPGSEKEFPLMDYFTVVLTLKVWLDLMEKNDPAQYERYSRAFKPLLDFCVEGNQAERMFANYLNLLGNAITLPGEVLYYLEVESVRYKPGRSALVLLLKGILPEKTSVSFNGARRPVHALSFIKNGPVSCTLKAGLLNPDAPDPDREQKVFIQQHALARLQERVDCFSLGLVYYHMCESFEDPDVIPLAKHKGLVGFYYRKAKIGYFAIEAANDFLVIRTFLFLTHDTTPEGKKLKERLGLARMDNKHNRLDKLSTFMLSDIREDEELCALLQETGCGDLLHWDENDLNAVRQDEDLRLPTAASIKDYLMMSRTA